jgi:hypothetical protein
MEILVADDDLASVKLTSFLLEDAGYKVIKAYDATGVLQRGGTAFPDLVLLDVGYAEGERFRHLPPDPPYIGRSDHFCHRQRSITGSRDRVADRRRRLSGEALRAS